MIAGEKDLNKIKDRRNILKVKEIIIHPGYISPKNITVLHDIAIMVLKSPIPMISGVNERVRLAQRDLPIGNKIEMR